MIDAVNLLFEHLEANRALAEFPVACQAWRTGYQPHTTAKTDLPGYACLQVAPRAAEGEKQNEVTLRFAAGEIARLAAAHPGRSIGVLVRRNAAVARLIFELRTKYEVLASEEGGNPLTDSAAVQLVLSLVRLADHPGDTAARFHVAASPLAAHLDFKNFDDDRAANRLSRQVRCQLLEAGYGQTVYGWVRQLAASCDQRELNRLLQLGELAYGYGARATLRADDFVAYVSHHRVEDPTPADVRVMTVHQAKGLEFDLVVLPELDIPLKGQPPRVVVGRSRPTGPIGTVCRYAGESVQQFLPEAVRGLFAEWPQRQVAESLCLLYVSMTRAAHALHMIIAPAKENEATWPKTFAGTLRGGLAADKAAAPGALLFELGSADWARRMPHAAAAESLAAAEEAPLELRLRASTAARELERRSPSSLEGGTQVDLKLLLGKTAKTFERGQLLHRWFQAIEWLDADPKNGGRPDARLLRQYAAEMHWSKPQVDEALQSFDRLLERPATRLALSRQGYEPAACRHWPAAVRQRLAGCKPRWEVLRERPFAVRQAGVLLSGAIDRLVLVYDGARLLAADILDFKTDRVSGSAEIAAKVEFYRPQLEAYRSAVVQMMSLDPAC
ncbi:MAG TPA: 3'-5' exonuclease, partial [Pirellulales bacterium]|nr:3'-5' exonuclease [Pirellulales bacterium]